MLTGRDHAAGTGRAVPTEQAATEWFERVVWRIERACGHCGSVDTQRVKSGKPMPYRCRDCKRYFSIKTGTLMTGSPLPVRKWGYTIYLDVTSLKSVSSVKLHRDIDVLPEGSVVHATAHPRSVPGRSADGLHRAGGGRRGLFRRDRAKGQVAARVIDSNQTYSAPMGSKAAGAAFKDAWSLSDVDESWHGEIGERDPALLCGACNSETSERSMADLLAAGMRNRDTYRRAKR